MPAASPAVSAILLAAGESIRMGEQKALLDWQGTTLLEYQLSQLAAVDVVAEIIVVTGHDPARISEIAQQSPRTRAAHNTDYRTGKVSSILTGLREIDGDAAHVLLLAVDQPRSSAIHRTLIDRHVASGAAITVPAHDGHRGHPVLFARALLSELLTICEETLGIRALMQRHASEIDIVEIDDASVTLDLNTPDDLTAVT